MREEPKIARDQLRACLEQEYGVIAQAIEFLPLGADMYAGVYRVDAIGGPYFLKLKATRLYAASCLVPRYLYDQGISEVVAAIPTREGTLWTSAGQWTALLYPFIDGVTGWSSMADEHWMEAGRIFKRIHEVALPTTGFEDVRRESFDPEVYVRRVDALEEQMPALRGLGGPRGALYALWSKHHPTTRALLGSIGKLAELLRDESPEYVVCHADLHPGNLLRHAEGRVFVVDWDDVMLAPREHDFLFTGEPADETTRGSAFFEGYGDVAVDWNAVTYYRYERVVQDLIEYARDVFRDDLEEETKANSVEHFRACFEGRNFAAAGVAAGHLAQEFRVSP